MSLPCYNLASKAGRHMCTAPALAKVPHTVPGVVASVSGLLKPHLAGHRRLEITKLKASRFKAVPQWKACPLPLIDGTKPFCAVGQDELLRHKPLGALVPLPGRRQLLWAQCVGIQSPAGQEKLSVPLNVHVKLSPPDLLGAALPLQDKISAFWEISKKDLEDKKAELRNKDREMEEMEERHQVEIKVSSSHPGTNLTTRGREQGAAAPCFVLALSTWAPTCAGPLHRVRV